MSNSQYYLARAAQSARDAGSAGLANVRDRLAQAYGDDHLFDIRTPPEGGFTVVIEIPHERQARAERATEKFEELKAKEDTPEDRA